MAEPAIKPDPDALGSSPAAGGFADDDIYEDAGDLEFNADPAYQKLYLARVPKYVWEAWSKLDDDQEVQIGTIRISTEKEPDGRERQKLQMLLRADMPDHFTVPKEYDLQVTSEVVQNTFVFTEKDLPGFKSRFAGMEPDMPSWLNRERAKDKPKRDKPYDRNKRFEPYYPRAIPKKTTLVGKVAHEVNCTPVLTPEAEYILSERTLQAMKPKAATTFLQGDQNMERGFIQPGLVRTSNAFTGFIKNTNMSGGKKIKSSDTKTARIPRNELMDRIMECFRRYNYWSMKALRAELQQPEAYIRQLLEEVAEMPRSGRFAMHWTLKPDYKQENYAGIDEEAPGGANADESDGEDDDDDEDDENVKMEDVLPS